MYSPQLNDAACHLAGTQTVWISDGCYSVHMMAASEPDTSVDKNDRNKSQKELMQISGFCNSMLF